MQQMKQSVTVVEQCIPLNNDALIYLEMGEVQESYKLLKEASSLLQRAIHAENTSTSSCHSIKPFSGNYYKWKNLSYMAETFLDPSSANLQIGSSCLFFYALWIEQQIPLGTADSNLARIWLIVNYNLALATHLLAMQHLGKHPPRGMRYLQEADRLYKTVQQAIETCCFQHFGMVALAVLNNQACMFTELGMRSQASSYWTRLCSELYSVSKESRMRNSTLYQQCQRFSLNLCIFRGTNTATAA
jgi:tetratricopeptide (TPR) repeat protein